MSVEANKRVFTIFVTEVLNGRRLDAVDEIFDRDFTGGLDSLKEVIVSFHQAFPDLEVALEDLVGEGDRTSDRLISRGTHRGDFLGIRPSGVRATWSSIGFCRFKRGKICQRWQCRDTLGLLEQLNK